jgi:hypothetical protein
LAAWLHCAAWSRSWRVQIENARLVAGSQPSMTSPGATGAGLGCWRARPQRPRRPARVAAADQLTADDHWRRRRRRGHRLCQGHPGPARPGPGARRGLRHRPYGLHVPAHQHGARLGDFYGAAADGGDGIIQALQCGSNSPPRHPHPRGDHQPEAAYPRRASGLEFPQGRRCGPSRPRSPPHTQSTKRSSFVWSDVVAATSLQYMLLSCLHTKVARSGPTTRGEVECGIVGPTVSHR